MINTIETFIHKIRDDIKIWDEKRPMAWFRGQNVDKPLIPKLYREDYSGPKENDLIQPFRMRARAFPNPPAYNRIDEWLFLMQHSGLPTRVLDWTEGALFALFFALKDMTKLKKPKPVVWMINPKALNVLPGSSRTPSLPLSWIGNNKQGIPECPLNIKAAFEAKGDDRAFELPIALMPQHVHPRVTAQRSCFIVYGKNKKPLEELISNIELIDNEYSQGNYTDIGVNGKIFGEIYLKKYEINPNKRELLLADLKILGISYATLFPDIDGLANEISENI
jgi:hypothetical protein